MTCHLVDNCMYCKYPFEVTYSAAIVQGMHFSLNPDFLVDQPVPITVSFDGTWQK